MILKECHKEIQLTELCVNIFKRILCSKIHWMLTTYYKTVLLTYFLQYVIYPSQCANAK